MYLWDSVLNRCQILLINKIFILIHHETENAQVRCYTAIPLYGCNQLLQLCKFIFLYNEISNLEGDIKDIVKIVPEYVGHIR